MSSLSEARWACLRSWSHVFRWCSGLGQHQHVADCSSPRWNQPAGNNSRFQWISCSRWGEGALGMIESQTDLITAWEVPFWRSSLLSLITWWCKESVSSVFKMKSVARFPLKPTLNTIRPTWPIPSEFSRRTNIEGNLRPYFESSNCLYNGATATLFHSGAQRVKRARAWHMPLYLAS